MFINHEYRLLKGPVGLLLDTDFATTQFVGLDFNDPALDMDSIVRGFRATPVSPVDAEEVKR